MEIISIPLSSLAGSEKLVRMVEDKSLHGLVGVDTAPVKRYI